MVSSKTIRQVVIPAAGLGTRFLPATKVIPKELLPILEKPALTYVIEELAASGIEEIILVLHPIKETIFDYFSMGGFVEQKLRERNQGDKLHDLHSVVSRLSFKKVYQSEPLGLGHAVLCAKEYIEDDYFAVVLPDDLVHSERPCLGQMMDSFVSSPRSMIAVEKVEREKSSAYGMVQTSGDTGKNCFPIQGLVEKPAPQDAPSQWGVIGRYLLSKKVFDVLEHTPRGAISEIQLTDALQSMIARGEPFDAFSFEGRRLDIGQPLGFLKANITMGLLSTEYKDVLTQFMKELI
ncbi:MAG: UTP--glucose-1-phosphate uridylyltransferase [Bdellovibrionales bacterium]|nr:UTP--glucose-1-phosphate uridylyltransferase [Bdellovibrionales bacterium]